MRLPRRRPPASAAAELGLTRLEPVSRTFGFERGKPVDRWYIERFLAAHAADVRGRVLEVAESTYTEWYGGDRVERGEVLHAAPGNPAATIVGDLTTGDGIPVEAFDCFVMTQTLQFIFDVPAAIRGTRALLKPGGTLLATLPGITQISREDLRDWGEWWRFTSGSAKRLFDAEYGADNVEVEAHGNVVSACAMLYGLAQEELSREELETRQDDYEVIVTVKARRV
jgi:hypothetical protein